jgi:hypothetical protein
MRMKEAYQEKADAQLREWRVWIDRYKADSMTVPTANFAEGRRLAERLEDCHRIARIRLDDLCSSQDDHWESAKQAVERAMIELKQALDESGATRKGKSLQLEATRSYVYEPFSRRG